MRSPKKRHNVKSRKALSRFFFADAGAKKKLGKKKAPKGHFALCGRWSSVSGNFAHCGGRPWLRASAGAAF